MFPRNRNPMAIFPTAQRKRLMLSSDRKPTLSLFPVRRQQRPNPKPSKSPVQGILSRFHSPEGTWDFGKMFNTAQKLKGYYDQFSPMLSIFLKSKGGSGG
ncbi:YppG family protein [Bacillus sp. V5-8f]|uniref:YppG family protein n=1 Tax=Bacillus sp. V5-8f TaxID=2053044 RepID=UPI000C7947EA|nr:YppG family protein [Bacillus sp. V5-8f]PLT33747.1 hypothetical protein CUU64_11565 [Bacillus sp. V5-8f]